MLIILSPAKTLDFESKQETNLNSKPVFQHEANALADILKAYSQQELAELFHVNPRLAELNYGRYQVWRKRPGNEVLKQAILAFKGDVYQGLKAEELNEQELKFAQQHLRMLSGLYGILKPMDLIQAYRLEMGTKLSNPNGNDLYQFWGDKITKQIKKDLKASGTNYLINLASKEYFKSIDTTVLNAEIITPVFKEFKDGKYKFMSVFGKKARGMMSRYIVKNEIADPQQLKLFDDEGYFYNDQLSKGNDWVFTRERL